MPVEDRGEQRRLSRSVRPDEPDLLATLDDDCRSVEELLVTGRERDVVGLEDDAPAARRVEEVEAERTALLRQRFDLPPRGGALLLEACDLRQLRLSLLRLRFLVAEPLDETLEAGDVDAHAVGGLAGRRRACRFLLSPFVPRPGEVVRSARRQLEHRRRDCLEEPAVVSDEDDRGVDGLELTFEPLEIQDVEVVRRLVEQEEIGAAGERSGERCARQLSAGERPERPIEVVFGEAEAAHGSSGTIAPGPTARVLETRLRLGVSPKCRVVVRAFGHRRLQAAQVVLDLEQIACTGERVLAERDVELERRALVVKRNARAFRERELPTLDGGLAGDRAQECRLSGAVRPRER